MSIYYNDMSSWILITGSSGFIGKKLVKKLLDLKFNVIGLDTVDFDFGTDSNQFLFKKVNLLSLDISELIENHQIDWVIHLAGISSSKVCYEQPEFAFNVNVQGSINILNQFKSQANKPHIILASSSEVYGRREKITPIREEELLNGNTPYALTKISAETAWRYYAETYGMKWTILRFSNTYGRTDSHEGYIVEYLIDKCLKNESPRINTPNAVNHFLFVNDHIDAYLKVIETNKPGIYNIAGPEFISIGDLYEKIKKLIEEKKFQNFSTNEENYGIVLSTEKARTVLDWEAKYTLNDGLREILKYFISS